MMHWELSASALVRALRVDVSLHQRVVGCSLAMVMHASCGGGGPAVEDLPVCTTFNVG